MNRTRKLLSVLLALLMVLALIPAAGIIPASAAGASVDIAHTSSISAIQANIQAAIDSAAAGETVTVTGKKTNVSSALILTIPAGKTVVWKATYTGAASEMIGLHGEGTFEVAAGGTISATNGYCAIANIPINWTSSSTVTILVSGGMVSVAGEDGEAIIGNNGNVIVTGGTVESVSDGGTAISASGVSQITISGGTVRANNGAGTTIDSYGNSVTVTGGMVQANDDVRTAIHCYGGNITVTGGTVQALGGRHCEGIETAGGIVTITGGTVEATGTGSSAILLSSEWIYDNTLNDLYHYGGAAYLAGTCIGPMNASDGLIVEIDRLAIPADRSGTSTGLTKKAGAGTAVWDFAGGKPVIQFGFDNPKTPNRIPQIDWGIYAALHSHTDTWGSNAASHWRGCACGNTTSAPAAHTPGNWIVDTAATATTEGKQHKECTVCKYITATEKIPALGTAAPVLTGPTELNLTAGYKATSFGPYTITGSPAPTVTIHNSAGSKHITWNAGTKKIDVAAGLEPGEYSITLKAVNSAGEATLSTSLKVSKTIFSTKYESNFWNWFKFIALFGFIWMWFV